MTIQTTDNKLEQTNLQNIATPAWPEHIFALQEARSWIAAALELPHAATIIPTELYAVYADAPDQRITARFSLEATSNEVQDVVYKANCFPLLAASARAHALVSRHCPGHVPQVIAWDDDPNAKTSRLVYVPFEGRSVAQNHNPELLVETARTLATIQNAVANSGKAKQADIPFIAARDIPSLFEAVVAHIGAHLAAWQTDEGGNLSKWLGLPAEDVLKVLHAARPQIERFAAQVEALGLPLSIDHGDLHGGNAFVQENGEILIYDWETAVLGCPLFSVEKLLVAAWTIDANPDGNGPWGYVPNTPTQARVRDAYLQALGCGDIAPNVFAAAMCLAVVKEMHGEIVWANLMGWQNGNPEWTAQLISRLRHHLKLVNEA